MDAQVVLITGASRGFGAAAARSIAGRGHTVVATMRDPARDAAAVTAGLEESIHPARLDAFPLVCLHAAAQGVPVLRFAGVAALEEMFGEDAATAPFPDVVALAGELAALHDPDRRARVGAAQRAHVIAHHDVTVAGPILFEHLQAASA